MRDAVETREEEDQGSLTPKLQDNPAPYRTPVNKDGALRCTTRKDADRTQELRTPAERIDMQAPQVPGGLPLSYHKKK